MNKLIFSLFFLLFICIGSSKADSPDYGDDTSQIARYEIFDSLRLGRLGLGRRAWDYAIIGYNHMRSKNMLSNPRILTIIDFTLPSSKKRMFVIDMNKVRLLHVTYVAHGRNTGVDKALYFSNEPESFKSSVGFYTTKGTYAGKHGYSMKMDGKEKGFNDNADSRAIVMHSAEYVNEMFIQSQGYIGRSLAQV